VRGSHANYGAESRKAPNNCISINNIAIVEIASSRNGRSIGQAQALRQAPIVRGWTSGAYGAKFHLEERNQPEDGDNGPKVNRPVVAEHIEVADQRQPEEELDQPNSEIIPE